VQTCALPIWLGDGELGEAVDHRRVTEGDEVEPSAAARPAGRGAKLVTGLPEQLAGFVEQLGRERPVANPGAVSLYDADDAVDLSRRYAEAGAASANRRVARRNVRVRAEVDVEQRSLGAFGEDVFAFLQRGVQVLRSVDDVGVDQAIELDVLLDDGVHIELFCPVDAAQDLVLFLDGPLELHAEDVAIEEVDDADAGPGELVHVGGSDAAAGR